MYKRSILLYLLLQFFFCSIAVAQHTIRFIIDDLPVYHKIDDSIFIAGSFNEWNPKNELHRFRKEGDKYMLELKLAAGNYEYKITGGSWSKVETRKDGAQKPNRQLHVSGPDTILIAIVDWAHHFNTEVKTSTASPRVTILDTAFYIPQLKRYRRVWLYLPESYHTSKLRYPVLYLHDGQNVFEDSSSYSGEWGIDEALDTLGANCREMIVVAIDNGGAYRLNEYAPYDMERYGKGDGDAYASFIVETLLPYIEKHYRVGKRRKDRFIAGSSMGGLISFYTVLKYPRIFGGAGIFSPSFWIAPAISNMVDEKGGRVKSRLYFFAGMQEGQQMVPDMLRIFEQMNQVSRLKMTSVIRAEGRHHESTWRNEFPAFYCWMINGKK